MLVIYYNEVLREDVFLQDIIVRNYQKTKSVIIMVKRTYLQS